jgi:hypothetical protein
MRPKILSGVQPFYIPWKGYFDLIATADEFIVGDDLQFVRHGWCNRNRIQTAAGLQWLTIPVEQKGRHGQEIRETRAASNAWVDKHLASLHQSYARAPYWSEYHTWLTDLYRNCAALNLSAINLHFISAICDILGIKTRMTLASAYGAPSDKNERIIALCKAVGASVFLTGPAARAYIDPARFEAAGIQLEYKRYNYPPYRQLYSPFEHGVTILDVILHCGPDSRRYMRSQ